MSDKKQNKLDKWAFAMLAPIMIGFGGALYFSNRGNNQVTDYVVTDKGANKIIYYSIKNPADTHVMTFDTDTVSFYPYINIGDTIRGDVQFISRPICKEYEEHQYPGPSMLHPRKIVKESVIFTVNGHELPELREIARRDSILRQMKQR